MDWVFALVPLAALSIPMLVIWTGHRRKVLALRSGPASNELSKKVEQLIAKNEDLEARVQTLETIATMDEGPRQSSRYRVGSEDTLAFDTTRPKSAKTA